MYYQYTSPEMIIPTGSVYVCDEKYRGECVQIGGTRPNLSLNLITYFYIKCRDLDGNDKYVKLEIGPSQKLILAPQMGGLQRDENGEVTHFMMYSDIYILDAGAPFYNNGTDIPAILNQGLNYSKEDGWSNGPSAESIVDAFREHSSYATIVDEVEYVFSPLLELP